MNATTFEKAAVYAVSQDTALLRLHVIPQTEWRESRR